MRLNNYTNIPDDKIRHIIKFVRPSRISNFDVKISNSQSGIGGGRAYCYGSRHHDRVAQFIEVKVTKNEHAFPYFARYKPQRRSKLKLNPQSGKLETVYYNSGTGGYINHILLSREEAVVDIIAHELRHLWQVIVKRGYRVWGARVQLSERDADAFAIRKLRKWRRRYGNQITDDILANFLSEKAYDDCYPYNTKDLHRRC